MEALGRRMPYYSANRYCLHYYSGLKWGCNQFKNKIKQWIRGPLEGETHNPSLCSRIGGPHAGTPLSLSQGLTSWEQPGPWPGPPPASGEFRLLHPLRPGGELVSQPLALVVVKGSWAHSSLRSGAYIKWGEEAGKFFFFNAILFLHTAVH